MFAIIKTGGKQYQVAEGKTITIERLPYEVNEQVQFEEVLMVAEEDGSKVVLGTPQVEGAQVMGTVLGQERSRKVRVEKFKAKVRYHKVHGHRQFQTKVQISKISM